MQHQDVVTARYAARSFTQARIPEERITELLELVRWTPSALNVQPWRFKVVRDAAAKEALAAAAWGQRHVAECSHVLVLCAEDDLEGQLRRLEDAYAAAGQEAQGQPVLDHAREIFSNLPPAALPSMMRSQVFIALGTALLAAKSLGLDSCPVTGFDPAAAAKALGLPARVIPVALCPLGYGTGAPAPRVRVPLSVLLLP